MNFTHSFKLIFLGLFASTSGTFAGIEEKTSIPLSTWDFTLTAPDSPAASWNKVSVPHCWNSEDAQDGGSKEDSATAKNDSDFGYYRGPGTYKTTLPPANSLRGQTYLRINAVSNHAEVFVNGTKAGEHSGAFGAFGYRITDLLNKDKPNTLEVRADNSLRKEILPISGDFPVYGGMYRPVTLEIKPDICFSPIKDGAWGLQTKQFNNGNNFTLQINADIDNSTATSAEGSVTFILRDQKGKIVAKKQEKTTFNPGDNKVRATLTVTSPKRWNATQDPYLYRLDAQLQTASGIKDTAKPVKIGFRTVEFHPSEGFKLNGKQLVLKGVCRHQDKKGQGWALSKQDHLEDIRHILDIGANAVRLAHYPHSEDFLNALDEAGIIAWAEIPFVNSIGKPHHKKVGEVTANQLKEMIRQQINHPSIVVWGLSNELQHAPTDDPLPLMRELNKLAHKEDETRKTTCAVNMRENRALCTISDVVALNTYPGWYGGNPERMGDDLKYLRKNYPDSCWAISEYGSGASINQHQREINKAPTPTGKWHPEEWQCRAHEKNWKAIASQKATWGTFIWNMFDFASVWRDEGDSKGINDKGLMTFDRKTKKDAYYFYKANWRKDTPVLHLQTRRASPTKDENMTIRFYSNLLNHQVTHNGKPVEGIEPYAMNGYKTSTIKLTPGKNTIKVKGTGPGNFKASDEITIVKE